MLFLNNFENQKMNFWTLDKIFVLDNLNFVQDKKYFVHADGRGKRGNYSTTESVILPRNSIKFDLQTFEQHSFWTFLILINPFLPLSFDSFILTLDGIESEEKNVEVVANA